MTLTPLTLHLAAEHDTSAFGQRLAALLRAGDVVALTGDIGTGKSTLARALIKARLAPLGLDEDIPSPSFTLVQTYQAGDLDIWHCDLYRLSHPDEVLELGLDDAFDTATTLIEWPDRLGDDLPARALHLTLTLRPEGEGRTLTLHWSDPSWTPRLKTLEMIADAD